MKLFLKYDSMKNSFVLIFLIPFFLISCGKSEEVKKVENPPILEKQFISTETDSKSSTGKTIATTSSGIYILKNDSVYWIDNWSNLKKEIKIEGADVPTFSIMSHGYNRDYAKDKNHVYLVADYYRNYGIFILKDADPLSFEILRGRFSRDKNSVYYWGQKIEWADRTTFIALGDWDQYGKDKNKVYIWFEIVDGADSWTFEILSNGILQDKRFIYENISQGPEREFSRIERK